MIEKWKLNDKSSKWWLRGGEGGVATAADEEVVEGALILNDRPCKLSEIN